MSHSPHLALFYTYLYKTNLEIASLIFYVVYFYLSQPARSDAHLSAALLSYLSIFIYLRLELFVSKNYD